VAGPAESAAAIRDVLAGVTGPRRDVVVLNSTAEAAIDTGAATRLLLKMVPATKIG
jgi:anthranilate phosphoribosyltransferase